jgi:hypothetical protein
VPGQLGADHRGDEGGGDHAVRDAAAERRPGGEPVVEMQRVAIARGLAEKLDDAVVDRKLPHCALPDCDRHVRQATATRAILQ